QGPESTGDWHPRDALSAAKQGEVSGRNGIAASGNAQGFARKPAIARSAGTRPAFDDPDVIRSALRTLPVIYLLILAATLVWTRVVLGYSNTTLSALNAIVMLALGGVYVLLSSRVELSTAALRGLDLGVTAMVASLITLAEFQRILEYSLLGD